jgi:hypothetical protein
MHTPPGMPPIYPTLARSASNSDKLPLVSNLGRRYVRTEI